MSDLRNQTPSTTYKGLLQVNDYSNGVDATSKFVQDGEGTNSALSISTTKVGVGTSSPSAPLDVTSTTGGVVFPRLTTTQRDAISSPTNGETIYNTTTTQVESYNGSNWVAGGTTVVANNAVTSNSIANDAVITDKINNDAVTTAKIADDAVTPAKLDETQTYAVDGLSSTSNIAITRAAEGPGLRLTYDATTDEVRDIFVDSTGTFKFTNVSGGGTQGTLMTLDDDGNLDVTAGVTGTNIVDCTGSLNQVVRSSSSANLGYVIMYSGGEPLNQKRVNLVPDSGKFLLSWVNDDTTAGYNVQLDQAGGHFHPGTTGFQDLGLTGNRWDDVWSNGTFNGSDQNIKQDIEDLDEAEKRVATKCKGLIKKYRMKDAVAKKGDDARIHVGIIAQELQAAFESEGLDAFRYSMIGRDTWWEGTDSEGKRDVKDEATEGYIEVTQMSVRYNELLAFIIAAM